jgi:hypothetical protein
VTDQAWAAVPSNSPLAVDLRGAAGYNGEHGCTSAFAIVSKRPAIDLMQLNEQERQVVLSSAAPVEVCDEQTREVYYVLTREQYRKMKALLDAEEIDPSFYEVTDIELFGTNDE